MNAPETYRSILRHHVASIEAKYPLKIVGLLPRGTAAHVFEENALDLLAEKKPGLSYFDIAGAEIALGDLLGRSVGIVMLSELSGREAEELPKSAEPL